MANCTACGAQQWSAADLACRSCGKPYAPPPQWQPPAPPPPMPPPPMAQPPMPPPAGTGGGAPVGRIVAIGGLVLALLAAGFVAWHFFWPRGGADSPEEAAETLLTSAAAQDPVGVIDMLSPAEVDGLDDVYDAALERAEDEGLVEEDGLTDALEIELTDLEFDVEELGDDLARVTLEGGHYEVTWDPDKLPERLDFLAEASEDESESGEIEDLYEDAFGGVEPYVTTVRIDGRWYVTLLGTYVDVIHTVAGEELAADADFDLADPDYDLASEDVEPITGEDPEEVIENLVDAVNSGDAEELLANLPEDLVKPLRPYLPVVEDLQEEGNWGVENGLSVSADDLDLSTEELDDGRLKVVIEHGVFGATTIDDGDVDTATAEVEGDCLTGDDGGGPGTGCLSDTDVAADLGLDEIFFVVSEVDGGYQFDPAATWVEYAAEVVDNLDGDLFDEIIEDLEEEV